MVLGTAICIAFWDLYIVFNTTFASWDQHGHRTMIKLLSVRSLGSKSGCADKNHVCICKLEILSQYLWSIYLTDAVSCKFHYSKKLIIYIGLWYGPPHFI